MLRNPREGRYCVPVDPGVCDQTEKQSDSVSQKQKAKTNTDETQRAGHGGTPQKLKREGSEFKASFNNSRSLSRK